MILGRQRGRQNEPDKRLCLPTFQHSKSNRLWLCSYFCCRSRCRLIKSGVAPAQAERQRATCPRRRHHITAFVQSLSHEAAWQGCGTEGKVQRKQPIGAQRQSCDMVTCSEERDISRQKHWTLTYQLMSHTDTGTFPLLRSLWKNQRRSEVIQHSFNTKTTE